MSSLATLEPSLSPSPTLFIHAVNIHSGGGACLLRVLLCARFSEAPRVVFVDQRFEPPDDMAPKVRLVPIQATITQRWRAERRLAQESQPGDLVLCLGNLPPLFGLRCPALIFLQNRYLIDSTSLSGFSLKTQVRLLLERCWLRLFARHAQALIVQTPSMQKLVLNQHLFKQVHVRVMPFAFEAPTWPRATPTTSTLADDRPFLYVASGEPHKNHKQLIQAWRLLASEGLTPALHLTLDAYIYPKLCSWIEAQAREYGLRIVCAHAPSRLALQALYAQAQALIYPSSLESLGLPLIEARQAGLPVLAPELDYVRDVLDPQESFDANSAVSIARAVKRFLGVHAPDLPLVSAEQFLQTIWQDYRNPLPN